MPRAVSCFSHHAGVFSLRVVGLLYHNRLFFILLRIADTLTLHQAGIYLSRLISRAFFLSPSTFVPRLHAGTPSCRHTVRIRTSYDSGTVLPSAHSTPSPLVPVYPSPAPYTPAAPSIHTHGWQGTRSTSSS